MSSNNINRVLSHYLQQMLGLYQGENPPGINDYCSVLKDLLSSSFEFLPGDFSKENVKIELNQKFLPGGPDQRGSESVDQWGSSAACSRSNESLIMAPRQQLVTNKNQHKRFAQHNGSPRRGAPGSRRQSIHMPYIRIWDGKAKVYGYIAALAPGKTKKPLNSYLFTDFYKRMFPNLILTDFFEFRYYREARKVCTARHFTVSEITGITNKAKVTNTRLFLKELQYFMDYCPKNSKDFTFIDLQQELALKTFYLRECVLTPLMNHLNKSGSKCELVRLYKAYCYFFDRELTVKEFSAFLVHVIIDGFLRAGIFYNRFNFSKENPFSRVRLKEFANLIGMDDRRLALFKFFSLEDSQLPTAVKWMLDDISWLISGIDFKQMGFDSNKSWSIEGEKLQLEDYFFKPYYENEEYKGILDLLEKAGIFSGDKG